MVESGGELQDLLTCGDCLEEFPLSDIVRFIRHKVSHGSGGGSHCVTSSPPVDDDDHDIATRAELSAVSPSHRLVCDSSLPGDEAAASDNRLNAVDDDDADDCSNHQSTCTGQSNTLFHRHRH